MKTTGIAVVVTGPRRDYAVSCFLQELGRIWMVDGLEVFTRKDSTAFVVDVVAPAAEVGGNKRFLARCAEMLAPETRIVKVEVWA